ncbi:MAG: CDP-2,3-bis-(O-geranylgeranyl)-sn-glycerol synthase [Thermoprotei archaeon]|nr:MAG: CDP-2,3-bis-(O-geranylgeranyl)-sn-glycerol synthase [Thermoprotei archaeon]HDD33560.1 CDP-2,3-bis-(O-geranylgeranyl)-sn-glycerol synthase [Thermofilaceae archaeon]
MRLIEALAAIALPCYVANATPVLVAKLLGRTHPLDFGLKLPDGHRLLGDGKSVEGFVSGVLTGTLTGYLLSSLGLSDISRAFTLSVGSMMGDALGSFLKRRLGLRRGDPAPLLDQLSFLVVALILYQLVYGGLDPLTTALLLIITPPIHVATNYLAYRLGLKDRPW